MAMRFRDTTSVDDTEPPTSTSYAIATTASDYIYPQPVAGGSFSLHYTNDAIANEACYTLISPDGRMIMNGTFKMKQGGGEELFRLSNKLPSGIYILQVVSAASAHAYKVLIDK
jgi:hypothetical protein